MLVITRDEGEAILIGDDILVMIVRDCGGRIRLGIDAPREVNIVRTELLPAEQQAVLHRQAVPRAGGPSQRGAKAS